MDAPHGRWSKAYTVVHLGGVVWKWRLHREWKLQEAMREKERAEKCKGGRKDTGEVEKIVNTVIELKIMKGFFFKSFEKSIFINDSRELICFDV